MIENATAAGQVLEKTKLQAVDLQDIVQIAADEAGSKAQKTRLDEILHHLENAESQAGYALLLVCGKQKGRTLQTVQSARESAQTAGQLAAAAKLQEIAETAQDMAEQLAAVADWLQYTEIPKRVEAVTAFSDTLRQALENFGQARAAIYSALIGDTVTAPCVEFFGEILQETAAAWVCVGLAGGQLVQHARWGNSLTLYTIARAEELANTARQIARGAVPPIQWTPETQTQGEKLQAVETAAAAFLESVTALRRIMEDERGRDKKWEQRTT